MSHQVLVISGSPKTFETIPVEPSPANLITSRYGSNGGGLIIIKLLARTTAGAAIIPISPVKKPLLDASILPIHPLQMPYNGCGAEPLKSILLSRSAVHSAPRTSRPISRRCRRPMLTVSTKSSCLPFGNVLVCVIT